MCGICGIYRPDPRHQVNRDTLLRMREAITHRGPDGQGMFLQGNIGLASRRLSIIDVKRGDQPIYNEDGTICIVYNGEIYNFQELRRTLKSKGHQFSTFSDTEVVVHSYEEYGFNCVIHFNGMFAFAIWDTRRRILFLARDRIGIKPLYYHRSSDGSLIFGSEIKSLLQHPEINRNVNPYAVVDYLTIQNVYGDKTFFEGIRQLSPGQTLTVKDGKFIYRTYWDLPLPEYSRQPESYFIERFRTLFQDSVRKRLISEAPLGCYLSGGIDSSSVTLTASRYSSEPLHTFTGAFQEGGRYDESVYARSVADRANVRFHLVRPQVSDFSSLLSKIVWHLDEPRVPSAAFPIYLLAREASKSLKVVLTGHGGDELFAGYPFYVPAFLRQRVAEWVSGSNLASLPRLPIYLLRGIRMLGFVRFWGYQLYGLLNEGMRTTGNNSFISPGQYKDIFPSDYYKQIEHYSPYQYIEELIHRVQPQDIFTQYMYLNIKTYLPMLLHLEDRMDMAHSLEGRVPFLDHRLVEFAVTIPIDVKLNDMVLKYVVREAMANDLPPGVLSHSKQGFPVPMNVWFRGPLREYVYAMLLGEQFLARGYVSRSYVKKILDRHNRGLWNHKQEIWNLLTLEIWHRLFIDSDVALRKTDGMFA